MESHNGNSRAEGASRTKTPSRSEPIVERTEYIDEEKKVPRFLKDKYKLKKQIGHGAHGRIYLGKDLKSKQPVAIKIVIAFSLTVADGPHIEEQAEVRKGDWVDERYQQNWSRRVPSAALSVHFGFILLHSTRVSWEELEGHA